MPLKAVYTFGKYLRSVYSHGESQHMHKITHRVRDKLGSIGHRSCKRIMKEKTPMLHIELCAFRCMGKAS